jgi:hypothetical protein
MRPFRELVLGAERHAQTVKAAMALRARRKVNRRGQLRRDPVGPSSDRLSGGCQEESTMIS